MRSKSSITSTLRRSLVFRTGALLTAIAVLALISMVSAIFISDSTDGDAGAINLAGSLRMLSYRTIVAVQEGNREDIQKTKQAIESVLNNQQLLLVIPEEKDDKIRGAYDELHQHWLTQVLPTLPSKNMIKPTLQMAQHADQLVTLIQTDAENKLRLLGMIQGITMFITAILLFAAMYEVHTNIVTPLRTLVAAAESMGQGDFSARIEYERDDELTVLGHAFNAMADDLSRIYKELEMRVEEKTSELSRTIHALRFINKTSRLVVENTNTQLRLKNILSSLQQTVNLKDIKLHITYTPNQPAHHLITATNEIPSLSHVDHSHLTSFSVANAGYVFGELLISDNTYPLNAWQREVLESVADLIATSLTLDYQGEQGQRLALMEERTVIARELHDSLAQSLSYLKIQVSRLQTTLDKESETLNANIVLDELREGLNSAYRQLRELLTTFRLKIDKPGLEAALRTTVEEYSSRNDTNITLHFGLQQPLHANQEIHILQIVREAIANVIQHANASVADISLTESDNDISVAIRDNGVGLSPTPQRAHHHGLTIMQERANTLGGHLTWETPSNGGTHILLTFNRNAVVNT
jgi:two-component system nitrate/nitrite sensor histidine kinase NarX